MALPKLKFIDPVKFLSQSSCLIWNTVTIFLIHQEENRENREK